MKGLLALGALVLVFALRTSPAQAQYIYLDSNGDGVHTSADVLHGSGPNQVDIWLDIGQNRDGSSALCHSTPPSPLDMFSYGVDLVATGGTVSYSSYTNHVSSMSLSFPSDPSTPTLFSTGAFYAPISTRLSAGRYFLGSVTVTVASGSPSLAVASYFNLPYYFSDPTFFGTMCDFGQVGANSYVFGVDWTDSDGLAFAAGGGANQPPSLAPIADMTVSTGGNASQTITATDPDGQPLTLAKTAGPAFLVLSTVASGVGSVTGLARLAPFASDAGTSTGTITVSDGSATAQSSFAISVLNGADHPPTLLATPSVSVMAGRVANLFLQAGDPDGGALQFAKRSGPSYVSVQPLADRPGGSTAALITSPSLCDVGTATAMVSVTDGTSTIQGAIALDVHSPPAPADTLPLTTPDTGILDGLALADFNRDGKLDVVVAHEDRAAVSVFMGVGDGRVAPPVSYDVAARSISVAAGDIDLDGNPDIACANWGGSGVTVLRGHGDGTFFAATTIEGPPELIDVEIADFNRDGRPDLVVASDQPGMTSVLLGQPDGTFTRSADAALGVRPSSITVGDYNLDGRLDVAVADGKPGSVGSAITVLPGLGDGTFGDPVSTMVPAYSFPFSLASQDWNGDGRLDVAFTDTYAGTSRSFLGIGDGRFNAPATAFASFSTPYRCTSGDLNGDGRPDFIVMDYGSSSVIVFLGDGQGGFGSPIRLRGLSVGGGGAEVADMNSDGVPDIVVAGAHAVGVFVDPFGPRTISAQARAFVPGDHAVPGNGSGDLAVYIEPVADTYTNELLDVSSVTLASEGTGSVSLIHSLPAKKTISADRDNNGIAEIGVSFSRADVLRLFDQLRGRTTVTADLAGSLTDGRPFCTDVSLTVLGKGQPSAAIAAASFAPNPLNPNSKLSFVTTRDGMARVSIFDVQGRIVRTLLDTPRLSAGSHELVFDGKTDRGMTLGSGVYFYRVESVDGRNEGQIVILK